jgi:hypothetical protein
MAMQIEQPKLPPTNLPKVGGQQSGLLGQAKTPGQAALQQYMTPEMSVSSRLQKVLQSKSPLLQTARQGALTAANRRGLANSSIAVGAAQRAAQDVALPIAAQDAATSTGFGQARQQFDYSSGLSAQQAAQQLRQQREGADLSLRAQTQA